MSATHYFKAQRVNKKGKTAMEKGTYLKASIKNTYL